MHVHLLQRLYMGSDHIDLQQGRHATAQLQIRHINITLQVDQS